MKKEKVRGRRKSSKPKKVTIRFFLNESVKPEMDGKVKRYPLYMLITYDRRNTMMRSYFGKWYRNLEEIDKVHYPGLLTMEERVIRKAIAYEMSLQGSEFDLKGLYKKYERYATGIHILLDRNLKNHLWSVLSRLEPFEYVRAFNFTDQDVEFSALYKIAKKVYKNLSLSLPKNFEQGIEIYQVFMKLYQGTFFQYSYPTVIEWLDGSAVEDYRNKLMTLYTDKSAAVKRSVEFLNKILQDVQ